MKKFLLLLISLLFSLFLFAGNGDDEISSKSAKQITIENFVNNGSMIMELPNDTSLFGYQAGIALHSSSTADAYVKLYRNGVLVYTYVVAPGHVWYYLTPEDHPGTITLTVCGINGNTGNNVLQFDLTYWHIVNGHYHYQCVYNDLQGPSCPKSLSKSCVYD